MATPRDETRVLASMPGSSAREVPSGPEEVGGKETKKEEEVDEQGLLPTGDRIKAWLNLFLFGWVVLPFTCMWLIILSPYILTYVCAVLLVLGFTSLWTGVWSVCTGPPITARRVLLLDGRHIAFEERGPPAELARHTIIVLHGILASRLSGFPRASEKLLWEFGVRVISFDRPGFGQSDYNSGSSMRGTAEDIQQLVLALDVHDPFWIMGLSGGGPHALACMHHLPEQLAGVVLWAPLVSPFDEEIYLPRLWDLLLRDMPLFASLRYLIIRGISLIPDYVTPCFRQLPPGLSAVFPQFFWPTGVLTLLQDPLFFLSRKVVQLLVPFVNRTTVPWLIGLHTGIRDRDCLASPHAAAVVAADIRESLRQGHFVAVLEDMMLPFRHWGFTYQELRRFKAPVHLFHGTDDRDVPITLSYRVKRELNYIKLYPLEGEGHYSWFGCDSSSHRKLLTTIFGQPQGPLQNSNGGNGGI